MRIPKRFKLLGHTIEVVENPELLNERNWSGAADYEKCRIELVPASSYYPVASSKAESVFCHELAHFLLYYAGAGINHFLDGKYAHQQDEFVDLLGNLIHQVLTTAEYEESS